MVVLGKHADTKKNSVNGEMFNDIKEASSFWTSLWEGNKIMKQGCSIAG